MLKDVEQFMRVAGKLPERGEPDRKLTGLYIGLILEEVAELMDSQGCEYERALLEQMSKVWKQGDFFFAHNTEALDAMIDIAWVAIGGAYAMGADVEGAAHAVAQNNLSKFPKCPDCLGDGVVCVENSSDLAVCKTCNGTGRTVLLDEHGKIKKPEGFKPVLLDEYL